MTPRQYLGDETIAKFRAQGFSVEQIKAYARDKYVKQYGTEPSNSMPSAANIAVSLERDSAQNLAPQYSPAREQNFVQNSRPQSEAEQGYKRVPIKNEDGSLYAQSTAGEVATSRLGLDGRPIPAAPSIGRSETERKRAQGIKYMGGAFEGLGKEVNTVLDNSIFGSGAPATSKDDQLRDKVALAQNTTIWQKLTGGEKDARRLQEDLDYIAKNAGYELGAVQTSDGKIYFGTVGADGRVVQKEVTPGISNDLLANKGEIIGGITATALAPFTGGTSLLPLLGASASGTAIGSMSDLYRRGEATGRQYEVSDYTQRALQSAGADALGGLALSGAGKLIKATAPAVKNIGGKAVNLADKFSEWGLVGTAKNTLKGLPTANAGGAKKAMSAIVGDEAGEILKSAEKLGGYTVDNNNFTDLQILNKPVNFIKDHLANTTKKLNLDGVSEFLNNAKGVNGTQRKIVDLALGDAKATRNIINALQGDKTGKAARNLADLAQSDVNALRQILPEVQKGNISRDISDFYTRISDDFGKMEGEIAQSLGGKTTSLSGEAIRNAKESMARNLNTFELKAPETKTLLNALEGLRDKPLDFSQLRKIKKDFNEYAQKIFNKDGHYGQKVDTSAVGKIIDDAVDRLIEGSPNMQYFKSELAKYSHMSKIKENPFFQKITDPNSSADDVLEAIFKADKAQGDILNKFSTQLSPAELEKFETDLLGELFNSQIAKRGTRNVTEVLDGVGLRENLQKIDLKSKTGKNLKDAMMQLANARGDLVKVFATVDKNFIKPTMPRAGIAQTASGLAKSILINRLKQSVFKYIGKIGDDAALDYHLREGLKALKVNNDLSSFMQAVKNSGADDEVTEAIVKAAVDEGRKMGTKNVSKATQNLGNQENINIYPSKFKNGEGFTMKNNEEAVPKSDFNVKFSLAPNVRDLAKLQTDEITADLEYLAQKHPEMFKGSPAEVFRLIKDIKENPTHFYANNRLDYGLIVKRLNGNKIGKLAVEKETGDVKHATRVDDKDLKRLARINKEKLGDVGIIQTFTRPGSKFEKNQSLGYQSETIIPQTSKNVKPEVKQKFNPDKLKEELIKPNLSEEEKINLIERAKEQIKEELDEKAGKVAKSEPVKQGEGFTMREGTKPYQYTEQSFKPERWVNDLSGVLSDEWAANLKSLAVKHPEMFKSEADVFRVIKQIKDNPTHFLENTDENTALIAKRLSESKAGNIGVDKSSGKIIHANKTDERDLNRLVRRARELEKSRGKNVGTPAPTTAPQARADGELLSSAPDKAIIPQTSKISKEAREALSSFKSDKAEYKAQYEQALEEAAGDDAFKKLASEFDGTINRLKELDKIERKTRDDIKELYRLRSRRDSLENELSSEFFRFYDPYTYRTHIKPNSHDANLASELNEEVKKAKQKILDLESRLTPIYERKQGGKFASTKEKIKAREIEAKIANVILDAEQAGINLKKYLPRLYKDPRYEQAMKNAKYDRDLILQTEQRYANALGHLEGFTPTKRNLDSKTASIKAKKFFEEVGSLNIDDLRYLKEETLLKLGKHYKFLEYKDPAVKGGSTELFASGQNEEFFKELKAVADDILNVPKDLKQNSAFKTDDLIELGGVKGVSLEEEPKGDYFKERRARVQKFLGVEPIKEFGTNYAEFYHDGINAVNKLLKEKQGQVAGAFYRDDLGDIDLVWGEVKKNAKGSLEGYGLAKIERKHPEISAEILDDVIKGGEIENAAGRYSIVKENYRVGLKSNFKGVPTKNKWVITAYEVTNEGKGGAKSIRTSSITSSDSPARTFDESIIPQKSPDMQFNELSEELLKISNDRSVKAFVEGLKKIEGLKTEHKTALLKKATQKIRELREGKGE